MVIKLIADRLKCLPAVVLFLNGVAEGFYCGFEGFEGGGAFHTGGL